MKLTAVFLLVMGVYLFVPCQAQSRVIKGQVKDGKNNALGSVTILEKGTSNGTVTDSQGKFSITVRNQHVVLVASYAGFASQEIDLGSLESTSVTFTLDVKTELRYWCCTDHPSPNGPHCDTDQENLKSKFRCQNFERQ